MFPCLRPLIGNFDLLVLGVLLVVYELVVYYP